MEEEPVNGSGVSLTEVAGLAVDIVVSLPAVIAMGGPSGQGLVCPPTFRPLSKVSYIVIPEKQLDFLE